MFEAVCFDEGGKTMAQTRMYNNGKSDGMIREDERSAINFNLDPDPGFPRKSNSLNQPRIDDLIMSLENAYENRRACQVNKWEHIRQPSFPLSV